MMPSVTAAEMISAAVPGATGVGIGSLVSTREFSHVCAVEWC